MKKSILATILSVLACNILADVIPGTASHTVNPADYNFTDESFIRAESNSAMLHYNNVAAKTNGVEDGTNHIVHLRKLVGVEDQNVVRSNNDTIYSLGVFSAKDGMTVKLPETDGRYQSVFIIDQDHYSAGVEYGAGEHRFKSETDFVFMIIRTQVDPNNAEDLPKVHQFQNLIEVSVTTKKSFPAPAHNQKNMIALRNELVKEAAAVGSMSGMMVARGEGSSETPRLRILGAASGWGLLPDADASYLFSPEGAGKVDQCYSQTFEQPPVDEFWSITMYGADSYLYQNEGIILNGYNTVANEDGTVTVYFGSAEQCGDVNNRLATTDGWEYLLRLYKPRLAELKSYTLPNITSVN
ncbi:MAG: DUF1254 domain-containing protein [Gammaproteobacteria bacterium]|nr:DUF1254 domain-containing protein [Gammaproteobacteria bacterium]